MESRIGFALLVLVLLTPASVFAQSVEKAAPPAAVAQNEPPSEAEKIGRLQRSVGDAEKQIDELTTKLKDPKSEYYLAEEAFRQIDELFEQSKKATEKLRSEGATETVRAQAKQDMAALDKRWQLSKERFDLAIEERKASQSKLSALEQKLQEDRAALARLSPRVDSKPAEPSATPPLPAAADGVVAPGASTADAESAPGSTSPLQALSLPKASGASQEKPKEPAIPPESPPVGATAQPGEAAPPPPADTSGPSPDGQKPPSEKLVKAQEAAATTEAAAKEAETTARSIVARIAALQEGIAAERKLLKTAQQQSDNANQTKRVHNEEMEAKFGAGSTWADLRELRQKVAESEQRITSARQEVRERTERLDAMQSELSTLQSERIVAMQQAEESRGRAQAAKRVVEALSNPFAPENLLQWLLDHGPRILGIALGIIFLLALARVLERRLVPVIARHSRGAAGSVEDRENRARTLLGVFHNAVRIVVIIGGGLMLLAEFGMNILPLITAAGVVGLAIAFGAQNLIRDYFYGFIILLENQYTINDVVRIGGIAGLVERITLRVTVLRDLEGVVHFMPHGEIKSVSNLTHGWSRAMFDIGVAYKEKPDDVMKVLMDLGRELRRDPEFSALILDDPEMLGVDQFGDSAVVIKFLIKTRPLKQWIIKREMLRRIKNKFDELGIEIPFPHRTVYHRYEHGNGMSDAERLPQWEEGPYAKR